MQKGRTSKLHNLNLSYNDYVKSGRTIANTQIDKYIVYDELGKGAFGSVYLGMDDQTKNQVAIKVLDLHAVQQEPNQRVKEIKRRLTRTESQLMMVCDSQNVVKCYNVYENRSLKILVIQFCNGGELQQQIKTKGIIAEREAILIIKQIINGIAELHTHNIIHRDLKAENILSHNGVYKIADMGFSKQVQQQDQLKQTTLGTITTMAPEVMKKESYGLKADIWSIGIIFFQMIFGKLPYSSTNATLMYHQIQTKKILNTQCFEYNNHKASKDVTSFLRDILTIDKQKRLGWKQLINHPIFADHNDRLSQEFRLNIALKVPKIKINENMENNHVQNQEEEEKKFQNIVQDQVPELSHQLIRLTHVAAKGKMGEVQTDQDQVYKWVKETHLQCLKTELIFNQIFVIIEVNNLLDLTARESVQFLYLILTRCLNNISVINDKIENEKRHFDSLTKLQQNVKPLYQRITMTWDRYAKMLTEHQNKIGSIINDKFLKIFKSKSIEKKDMFLTGIEKMYYTKEEQIKFTDEEYIPIVLKEMKGEPKLTVKIVKNYLSHYVEINKAKLDDLKQRSFKEYVEMILQ